MIEKYKIIRKPETTKDSWDIPLNTWHQRGYKIHTVKDDFIVMKLDEPSKYEDVDAVKQASHNEVESYVSNGWIIDSIFSKHAVLVRKKE